MASIKVKLLYENIFLKEVTIKDNCKIKDIIESFGMTKEILSLVL